MKQEVFESQQAFAGEKKPSMQRRCVGHDYLERMMYMVTMVVEGRRPLLGTVTGRSDAPADSQDAPRVELSALGQRVSDEWWGIPQYYPQVEIRGLQMMPDHLHGVIFVKEKMEHDLSRIIRGFKTGCNRHYRALFPSVQQVHHVQYVATESQQTQRPKDDRTHGLLFARGFNDKLLLRQGQLQRWMDYLLQHGFNYWFDLADIEQLKSHVEQFMAPATEEQLIKVYFSPAQEDEPEARFLTVAEISAKLILYGVLRKDIDNRRLGAIMTKLNYVPSRSGRNGTRGYIVREHTPGEIEQLRNPKSACTDNADNADNADIFF